MGLLDDWGSKPMDLGAAKQRVASRQGGTPGYRSAQPATYSGGRGGFAIQQAQPEYFNMPQFAAAQGFNPQTPTGQAMPSGTHGAWQDFIQKTYGMGPKDFLAASPEERYAGWAGGKGMATNYEEYAKTLQGGVPTAPPGSPQEAAWAQFAGGLEARRLQQEAWNNQIAALEVGGGLYREGGPGSSGAFAAPMYGAMANAYGGRQFGGGDYSYWTTAQTPTPAARDPMMAQTTRNPEYIGQAAGGGQQQQPFRGLQSWQFG